MTPSLPLFLPPHFTPSLPAAFRNGFGAAGFVAAAPIE